jgi:hypothetical protein
MSYFKFCLIAFPLFFFISCSDGGSDSTTDSPNQNNPAITSDMFISKATEKFLGQDYSYLNPDGLTDSDNDGEVDVNDAVIIIRTLQNLGYSDLKPATISGIYNNFYTDLGFGYKDDGLYSVKTDFNYTKQSSVTESDLKNMSWNLLDKGDLIFIDYDNDFVWDNAAIYLGKYNNIEHAAFYASDLYDKAVIVDLSDQTEQINTDISSGYSAVKKLALIQ